MTVRMIRCAAQTYDTAGGWNRIADFRLDNIWPVAYPTTQHGLAVQVDVVFAQTSGGANHAAYTAIFERNHGPPYAPAILGVVGLVQIENILWYVNQPGDPYTGTGFALVFGPAPLPTGVITVAAKVFLT